MALDHSLWSFCYANGRLPADFMGGCPVCSNQGMVDIPMVYSLIASAPGKSSGRAILVDTGGTAILRDAGVPAPPLRHGWRSGTPQYMAPELWAGRPHTVATDLYAATGVLVDALTGDPPYLGTDLSGLGVQHTQGALPSELVPMIARALVVRGLAKDPRDRGRAGHGLHGVAGGHSQ